MVVTPKKLSTQVARPKEEANLEDSEAKLDTEKGRARGWANNGP